MKRLSFNLIEEIKKTILKTKNLKNLYDKKFPNSKYKFKNIINDIIFYLKSGASLRNTKLNVNFKALHFHLQRFKKYDIFKRTYVRLIKENKLLEISKILLTDTSFINNNIGINKLGRNKFNKSKRAYKLSFITDENGIPLDILLDPSNRSDITILHNHVNRLQNKLNNKILLADSGYCSNKLRDTIRKYNCTPIIYYNNRRSTNERKFTNFEKEIYKKRIKIENIFCYFKKFRNMKHMNMKYYSSYFNLIYLTLLCLFSI